MAYTSLSEFIAELERMGELVRIKEFVSPRLEITEITDRVSKAGGKALLFENNGTSFPLLINAMGSEKRINIALGVSNLDQIGNRMEQLLAKFTSPHPSLMSKLTMLPALNQVASWQPSILRKRGKCQEVVMEKPDLSKLPVLTCWPADGGPFITLPVVHTKHPVSGLRNLGMYRMQVFGPDVTGMHWHLHKNSAAHYREYKVIGKRMPVAVTLGGDPAYTYAATAPLPENIDEYMLAGFLRKKKVELVKCLTCDLEVPSDVDFVIEGYVDPAEDLILEGPFGDHTGFYSLADFYPRFHVTCISHRNNAVYPATIVGIPPQEDAWIGLATERIFLTPIRLAMVPEILDMAMPSEGVFHNIVLVKIKKLYPGQAEKIMNALWGAGQMMFNKTMVVLDGEVDIHNYHEVASAIQKFVNPASDIVLSRGPLDVLDHSSGRFAYGSKLGMDATHKDHHIEDYVFIEEEWQPVVTIDEACILDTRLLRVGVAVLIAGISKEKPGVVKKYHETITSLKHTGNLKAVLYIDKAALDLPLNDIIWLVASNLEPMRDCFFATGADTSILAVDGTSKSRRLDGFERQWPNVLVMNEEIIDRIDEKWSKLGLGSVLPSPSLKYKGLVRGNGAVADDW